MECTVGVQYRPVKMFNLTLTMEELDWLMSLLEMPATYIKNETVGEETYRNKLKEALSQKKEEAKQQNVTPPAQTPPVSVPANQTLFNGPYPYQQL